jgi:pilus assembly protein FimV
MPAIRRLLAVLLLVLPFTAAALGLGHIEVASGLNQPFDARIPIIGAKPGEIVDVSASLAEQQAFERAGLARPYSLNRLKFSVVPGEGESGYVHITSREAVREPALEFIIEVKWRNGSMQRKYGVLLEHK